MARPFAPSRPSFLARGTLGRKLVLRVVVIATAVALLLGLFTTLATRQLLIGQLDRQLYQTLARQQQARGGGDGDVDDDRRQAPGGLLIPGQSVGTLAAEFRIGSEPTIGLSTGRSSRLTLPDEDYDRLVAQLQALPPDGSHHSVHLAGPLDRYRLIAQRRDYGVVVIGLPLRNVDTLLVQLLGLEALLALLAMAGALVGARALVIRDLRPLNRVAAAAQQVSDLPLDRGEVALAVRVAPVDADPTSEVGRVGQALNHMLNNVEDALAARQASEVKLRQFVADASHELRNPLAAIRGYAELTRRSREELPADAAFAMSRVESEAERMSYLVEDLLLLARLDSGPDLDLGPVDLSDLVVNAVSDARAAGPEHAWQLALPSEPVVALGDRHRLHQVVANLLANARTHTPPGTRVEAGISVHEGQAVVTVTDSGPGIPAEIREHAFERFTRADASRVRSEGAAAGASTGLGLAIVAAVVDAHQGTVTVESAPGRTTFTVRLPMYVPEPVEGAVAYAP